MPLSSDLREFIECLNSNEVEYLVVGALAVSWHGFPRYSADIDFLIRPSDANAVRVLRALSQFGFGSLDISPSDLTLAGKVIQLGYEPNRIDLMTSVTGVSFDDAWDDRAPGDLDGGPHRRRGTPEAKAVDLVSARPADGRDGGWKQGETGTPHAPVAGRANDRHAQAREVDGQARHL
jgi:hypothetical protein